MIKVNGIIFKPYWNYCLMYQRINIQIIYFTLQSSLYIFVFFSKTLLYLVWFEILCNRELFRKHLFIVVSRPSLRHIVLFQELWKVRSPPRSMHIVCILSPSNSSLLRGNVLAQLIDRSIVSFHDFSLFLRGISFPFFFFLILFYIVLYWFRWK